MARVGESATAFNGRHAGFTFNINGNSEGGTRHQLTLMCDDIGTTVDELRSKGIEVRGEPEDEGWGISTMLVLPGRVEVMLYEPRHRTAI